MSGTLPGWFNAVIQGRSFQVSVYVCHGAVWFCWEWYTLNDMIVMVQSFFKQNWCICKFFDDDSFLSWRTSWITEYVICQKGCLLLNVRRLANEPIILAMLHLLLIWYEQGWNEQLICANLGHCLVTVMSYKRTSGEQIRQVIMTIIVMVIHSFIFTVCIVKPSYENIFTY